MTAAVILHFQSPENQCPLLRQNSCIAQKHRSGAFFGNMKAQKHAETVSPWLLCRQAQNAGRKISAQYLYDNFYYVRAICYACCVFNKICGKNK
jgi:hypothetical protein